MKLPFRFLKERKKDWEFGNLGFGNGRESKEEKEFVLLRMELWIDGFFAWNCFKEEKWQLKETVDETQ